MPIRQWAFPVASATPKPPISRTVTLGRLSDRALFTRAAGDETAFAEIVRRYREPLRRHAARYVGDADAEDVVQLALVNASLALRREPERDIEPKPWLYKVTTNAAIDHRRAQAVRPLGDRPHEEIDLDTMSGSGDPHQVLEGRESVRSMVSGIQELAPNQRRAATARFLEGRSHDEIADELGVSKGAARELIHRAKRNLREAIPALSPLPLFGRFRDAIGGLFAGSGSVGAAKLAAGAVAVVAAAGVGGIALSEAQKDEEGRTPAAALPAAAAQPTPALPTVAAMADRPHSAQGGGNDGDQGASQGGSAGSGSAGGSQPSSAGGGTQSATPVAADSAGTGAPGGSASNPVQDLTDQLGVGEVTDQVGATTDQVGAGVNQVGDQVGGQLGIDVPDVELPNTGDLLGGN